MAEGVTVESILAETGRRISVGRRATPEEVADVAVFLASVCAASLTGIAVAVDGGSSRALV